MTKLLGNTTSKSFKSSMASTQRSSLLKSTPRIAPTNKLAPLLEHNRLETNVYSQFMEAKKAESLSALQIKRESFEQKVQDTSKKQIVKKRQLIHDIMPKFLSNQFATLFGTGDGEMPHDDRRKVSDHTGDEPNPFGMLGQFFTEGANHHPGEASQTNNAVVDQNNEVGFAAQAKKATDQAGEQFTYFLTNSTNKYVHNLASSRESLGMVMRRTPNGAVGSIVLFGGLGSDVNTTIDEFIISRRRIIQARMRGK